MNEALEKKFEKIVDELSGLKLRNIRAFDVEESGVSKFLVVATAININENKKLAMVFAFNTKYDGKIDGFHKGEWIIFDFDEVVVHLFASGFREKYNMDKLYKGKEVSLAFLEKKRKAAKKKNEV